MLMTRDFIYQSKSGDSITLSLYGAEHINKWPLIIYVHGFKGFKDWGFVPYMGEYMSRHGLCVLTFNFSLNGIGEQPDEFTELDKFEANTLTREVNETMEIIKTCTQTDLLGEVVDTKIGLLGHSRGGGIAILAGKKMKEVSAICTWAAVSTFDRYDKKTKQKWREKGFHEVLNKRTGQVFRLGKDLLIDLEKNAKGSLNILDSVRTLEKPFLIIHGHDDETVPFYDAEQLNIYASPELTTLRLIPKTGHTFGTKHPFDTTNEQLELALSTSGEFFNKYLLK